MSDQKHKDHLDRLIRERYEEHQVNPPGELWEKIDSKVQENDPARFDQKVVERLDKDQSPVPGRLWELIKARLTAQPLNTGMSLGEFAKWLGFAVLVIGTTVGLLVVVDSGDGDSANDPEYTAWTPKYKNKGSIDPSASDTWSYHSLSKDADDSTSRDLESEVDNYEINSGEGEHTEDHYSNADTGDPDTDSDDRYQDSKSQSGSGIQSSGQAGNNNGQGNTDPQTSLRNGQKAGNMSGLAHKSESGNANQSTSSDNGSNNSSLALDDSGESTQQKRAGNFDKRSGGNQLDGQTDGQSNNKGQNKDPDKTQTGSIDNNTLASGENNSDTRNGSDRANENNDEEDELNASLDNGDDEDATENQDPPSNKKKKGSKSSRKKDYSKFQLALTASPGYIVDLFGTSTPKGLDNYSDFSTINLRSNLEFAGTYHFSKNFLVSLGFQTSSFSQQYKVESGRYYELPMDVDFRSNSLTFESRFGTETRTVARGFEFFPLRTISPDDTANYHKYAYNETLEGRILWIPVKVGFETNLGNFQGGVKAGLAPGLLRSSSSKTTILSEFQPSDAFVYENYHQFNQWLWAFHGSVSLGYQIVPRLLVLVEPTYSLSFTNLNKDAKEAIRPRIIGLMTGLKFEF